MKGTIGIDNHSSLVVNLKSGIIDFIGEANTKEQALCERQNRSFYPITDGYYSANPFYAMDDAGVVGEFMGELITAMKGPDWFDDTDSQIDYFHCAHYIDINVGKWNKPYVTL